MSISEVTKQAQAFLPSKKALLDTLSFVDRKTVLYATLALAFIGAVAISGTLGYASYEMSQWDFKELADTQG